MTKNKIKINQAKSQVGRDQIGVQYVLSSPSELQVLNDQLELDLKNGNVTEEFIDELTHYSNIEKNNIRDLKAKLSDAGFSNLVEKAEEYKEFIAKLLYRYSSYAKAQEILLILLSRAHQEFIERKPDISKISNEDELMAFLTKITRNIIGESELQNNVLNIRYVQLLGLVFYLAGNCHIQFD